MAKNKDNTGARIKALRRRLGLTQDDFAVRAGLGPRTMSNLETGKRAAGFEVIRRICYTYGVCVEWLTTGEGDMFARGVQHNVRGGNIQGERATVTRHAGESEARHLLPEGRRGHAKKTSRSTVCSPCSKNWGSLPGTPTAPAVPPPPGPRGCRGSDA